MLGAMGKPSSSQPSTPNPAQVSAGQTASNIQTGIANAWLNSPNIVTPYGNIATTQTGQTKVGNQQIPQFTETQTLSPEQQKIYEQGVQGDTQLNQLGLDQIGRISNAVSTPFSLDAFGPAPTADAGYRQQQQDALQARLNPQLDRSQAALDQRLANQGISLGSQAYNTAQNIEGQNRNDANLGVIAQSGNEEAQQYGLQSGAYQQGISNALLQRQQPLQEFAQFTGASNNFAQPNVVGTTGGNIQPTDTSANAYNSYAAQNNQYQNQQQTQNSLYGSLAGLGGSALGGWASSGFAW